MRNRYLLFTKEYADGSCNSLFSLAIHGNNRLQ